MSMSLPSFAQAFSSSSLSDTAHISNALPPIQPKKRPRASADPYVARPLARPRPNASPASHTVRIKEEDPPMSPPLDDDDPSSKKRRVTVGAIPPERTTPIPISPVDPVRVHKHPKTLVDRPPATPSDPSKLARVGRISPTTANRGTGNAVASGSQATTASPPPLPVEKPPPVAVVHSLPPPPISFARRRAAQPGGRKKKPADIVISPRGSGPSDPLAPVIQSAPPVPDPGRFPMVIPRLPLMMNVAQPTRRVAGNVPPTPTRFSLQGTSAPSISSTARTVHSPPSLPVPIANTLVPPTPHVPQLPGYAGDKSAFLAPFEVFYDALHDSKQLKGWLSEQLQKSNTLVTSLKQQQEKMDELVEDAVEKRTRAMREEITMLRQRMESLEEALLAVRAESSASEYPPPHPNGTDTLKVTSPEKEREPSSVSPPIDVTRRPSVSAPSGRAEVPGLHYGLGGHHRSASGSKGTPVVRTQSVSERSSTARPTESRTASRLWSYGNSNPPVDASSRGGDKS